MFADKQMEVTITVTKTKDGIEYEESYSHPLLEPMHRGRFYDKAKELRSIIDNKISLREKAKKEQEKPKEWEIVSYSGSNGGIWTIGSCVNDTYRGEFQNPAFWLTNKSSETFSIHSVKRLSDGEVFTIGDKTFRQKNDDTISAFQPLSNGEMVVKFQYGVCNINFIEKEKPKEKDVFDGGKLNKFLIDEIGQMPIVFKMNGCKFRLEAFKMAYEMSHPKSIQEVTKRAQEIIDWINENHKPLLKFSPQEKTKHSTNKDNT